MLHIRWIAVLVVASALSLPGAVFANHNMTSLVSTGPAGGNGPNPAVYRGASEDGTRAFFQTDEPLAAADTDTSIDLYERLNSGTTLLSTGPSGGNGPNSATFAGASADGLHVFFKTTERLVSADTDNAQDVYERYNGTTTLVSTGPTDANLPLPANFDGASADGSRVFFDSSANLVSLATDTFPDIYERAGGDTTLLSIGPVGGNGDFFATFRGASKDGTRVFDETDEPLVADDLDGSQDVYVDSIVNGFARPKGATPMRIALVPAYRECTVPNRMHGGPLAVDSCNPPKASSYLTVGTADANGQTPASIGAVRIDSLVDNPNTPADEANVKMTTSITDVRRQSDLSDYTGELQLLPTIRVTDRLNGTLLNDPATSQDVDFPVTIPCVTTSTAPGSTCSLATTAESVVPGLLTGNKRTIWQVPAVNVCDGGADGVAATPDNTLFETSGLFVP